jgi:hypothetical protein
VIDGKFSIYQHCYVQMNPIQKAKAMLPDMPKQVFDEWLLPIIKDHNSWPYTDASSLHPSQQWEQYFGLFSFIDIVNLKWQTLILSFDLGGLDSISNNTIKTLIDWHVHNLKPNSNIHNSKNRFYHFVSLIKEKHSIPSPIIGVNTDEGLRVLDGNHRLSALTYLGLRGKIKCSTWIGIPNI